MFNFLPSPAPSLSASAAPVVTLLPFTGEMITELLLALGVGVLSAEGAFLLNDALPYIYDAFNSFGSDIEAWASLIPNDVYYTDGAGTWYIGKDGKTIVNKPSQLVLKGNCVSESFVFPVNSLSAELGLSVGGGYTYRFLSNLSNLWRSYPTEQGFWYVPFLTLSNGTMMIGNTFLTISQSGFCASGRFNSDYTYSSSFSYSVSGQDLLMGVMRGSSNGLFFASKYTATSNGISVNNSFLGSDSLIPTAYFLPDGSTWTFSTDQWNSMVRGGYLVCDGIPQNTLVLDKEKLDDVLVSPGGSQPPDDGDDDKKDGLPLVPPSLWDVFETVADFIADNNNHTTVKDYVNNNYNYNIVDVDVNIPERFNVQFSGNINADVNLGGGLNFDITIKDDVSLPSITDGDGENFFGADAIDVFAGLTKNNPVMSTIASLFGVVDPALVAVFSVTLSLGLLLALWKLIRG